MRRVGQFGREYRPGLVVGQGPGRTCKPSGQAGQAGLGVMCQLRLGLVVFPHQDRQSDCADRRRHRTAQRQPDPRAEQHERIMPVRACMRKLRLSRMSAWCIV